MASENLLIRTVTNCDTFVNASLNISGTYKVPSEGVMAFAKMQLLMLQALIIKENQIRNTDFWFVIIFPISIFAYMAVFNFISGFTPSSFV